MQQDNVNPDQKATVSQTQDVSNKELNFRALEQKYQRQLEQERQARLEAERIAQEAQKSRSHVEDDEDDSSDPYVDHKKLSKKLSKHGQQIKQETQSEIKNAVQQAIYEERKQNYLNQNKDFFEVLGYADKLMAHDPELCETILSMPEGFERQKLVYKNIKSLGLHQDKPKEPSVQEKIDANRRSPYYQPSNVGTAGANFSGDFSPTGQKQAYEKMMELKNRMRLG